MLETKQKYELLALLPLNATDDGLKAVAGKIESRMTEAGATVQGSTMLQKGRLAYPVNRLHQGYYHTIQFEMEPKALPELRRTLTLSGGAVRFTISKVHGAFKQFVPSAPRVSPVRPHSTARPIASATYSTAPVVAAPAATLTQETVKPSAAPKVTMEELDKRLEEILGE